MMVCVCSFVVMVSVSMKNVMMAIFSMVMVVLLTVMLRISLFVQDQHTKSQLVTLTYNHKSLTCTVSEQMVLTKVHIISSLNHHLNFTTISTSLTLSKSTIHESQSYMFDTLMAVFKFNLLTIQVVKVRILQYNGNLINHSTQVISKQRSRQNQ